MQKYKTRIGRQRIVYSHTGEFDAWVPATMQFLGTMMPPTLSKRAAAMLLLVAGMGNEEIVALTGMCIRSVRALRKTMEEQEPTSELFVIKPGSGRKRKTEGIEEEVFRELVQEIRGILDQHKIEHAFGLYKSGGTGHVGVIACKKWRFLRRCESIEK